MVHRKETSDGNAPFADDSRTLERQREVQIIVNLIEPDPEFQPSFISDEANIYDICMHDEPTLRYLLERYFGQPMTSKLNLPMWQLVDSIKAQFSNWPDDWERVDIRTGKGI